MEYTGKLYGKIGRRIIPLALTSEYVDTMQLDMQSREREIEELREAAQALVDRWETPLWKDAPATAGFINRLRALLPENVYSEPPNDNANTGPERSTLTTETMIKLHTPETLAAFDDAEMQKLYEESQTPYNKGYREAIRHLYEAAGMAITSPCDEDILIAHVKQLRQYRDQYHAMEGERDEARAAYENETLASVSQRGFTSKINLAWFKHRKRLRALEKYVGYDMYEEGLKTDAMDSWRWEKLKEFGLAVEGIH